jgi:hypothetical protein
MSAKRVVSLSLVSRAPARVVLLVAPRVVLPPVARLRVVLRMVLPAETRVPIAITKEATVLTQIYKCLQPVSSVLPPLLSC